MKHLLEDSRKLLQKKTGDKNTKLARPIEDRPASSLATNITVDLKNFINKDVIIVKTTARRHTSKTENNSNYEIRIAIYNVIAFIKKIIADNNNVFNNNIIKSAVYAAFRDSDKEICKNPNGSTGVNKYYCSCPDFRFRFANQVLFPNGQLFHPKDNIKRGYSERLENSYERTKKDVIDKNGKIHYVDKDSNEFKSKDWRELTDTEKKELSKKRQTNPQNKGALCKHLLSVCKIGDKENAYWVNQIVKNIYLLFKEILAGKNSAEQSKILDKLFGINIKKNKVVSDFSHLITALCNDPGKTFEIDLGIKSEEPKEEVSSASTKQPKEKQSIINTNRGGGQSMEDDSE